MISLGSTLAVLGASIGTLQFGHVDIDISYTYARLGIASAILTFFPLLFMYVLHPHPGIQSYLTSIIIGRQLAQRMRQPPRRRQDGAHHTTYVQLPSLFAASCGALNIILPSAILSVFWLAAGGVTVVTRTNVFGFGPCDDFTDFTQNGLCAYAEPISTFSFVPAGLSESSVHMGWMEVLTTCVVLTYELLLLLIGWCGVRREKPIWAHPVRGPAIRNVGL